MDYKEARDEIRPHLQDYVERVTTKSKGNFYVCPLCGSGTKSNHTGAFRILKRDPLHWICYQCGESGDIFDLIGKVENIPDALGQLKRAGELYGITIDSAKKEAFRNEKRETAGGAQYTHTHNSIHTNTQEPEVDDKVEVNYIAYYKECQSHLKETDYLTQRGISEGTASRYMLGYDPHYSNEGTGFREWKVVIIPTGIDSYVARNTDPRADKGYRYRKTDKINHFNLKALQTAKKPIYIVEGELDALSIIEVGGEAIGLGSTAYVQMFLKYLGAQAHKPAQPLVISMDNDKAGEQAAEKLEQGLKELGIEYYKLDPCNGLKDANTALLADRDAFTQAVAQAEQIKNRQQEADKESYYKDSAYNHIQEFIDKIAVNTPAQPTGFTKLDATLDGGLYEGLYIIGAITSLGKTTLALQIADQIAESGKDVLIFSLEMARAELMSKSISRHTLDLCMEYGYSPSNAKTNRGITAGARYEHYSKEERELIKEAINAYGAYAKHIYIHEGVGSIGVDFIRDKVRQHLLFTGQAPVVLIDYLQILSPYDVRATDKQNTDKAVLELKRISRDYKIPVIGISSFNRANYNEKVSLESFKESGAIEYGSDVLIGLQLKGAGTDSFDATDEKKKNPRDIELVILKNRNGETGGKVDFKYYTLFNYFMEA